MQNRRTEIATQDAIDAVDRSHDRTARWVAIGALALWLSVSIAGVLAEYSQ